MGLREEPGKQKTRSCRTQELARSSARENEWQKKGCLLNSETIGIGSRFKTTTKPGENSEVLDACHERSQVRPVAPFLPVATIQFPVATSR